jgi:16S rRNA (uracil1498-N3)-methyltransferase
MDRTIKEFSRIMTRYDFRSPRLYVGGALAPGATAELDPAQAHYLKNVLRLKAGEAVLVFNGRDGEWHGLIDAPAKRRLAVIVDRQTRPQPAPGDLHFLFAPLKRGRLDYTVQKAVEMGATRLQPILTRHTQAERVNLDRMRANAIEAAEQCGILALPETFEPVAVAQAVVALDADRLLVFCDEDAPVADPVAALSGAMRLLPERLPSLAVLIGPEGGFAEEERGMLLKHGNIVRLALGPRILRADTAAVAALALVQAVLGDWR